MIVTIISKRCTNSKFCPKILQGKALRSLAHYRCVFFLIESWSFRMRESARQREKFSFKYFKSYGHMMCGTLATHSTNTTTKCIPLFHTGQPFTPGKIVSRPPSPLIRKGNFPNNDVQLCFSTPEIIINPMDPFKSYDLWLKPPFFDQSETGRPKSLGPDRWCRR